jgi:hypothetical protein
MKITKEQLKQIILQEIKGTIIDKVPGRPMEISDIMRELSVIVGHGEVTVTAIPALLRDLAKKIEDSHSEDLVPEPAGGDKGLELPVGADPWDVKRRTGIGK